MLYTLAFTRWKNSRSQQHARSRIRDEVDEDPLLPASANATTTTKPRGKSLRGSNILLMWLPALCDLSGTTVRFPLPSSSIPPLMISPRVLPSLPSLPAFLPSTSVRRAPSSPNDTARNITFSVHSTFSEAKNQLTKRRNERILTHSFPSLRFSLLRQSTRHAYAHAPRQ